MKPEEWKQTEKEFIKWQTERRRNLQPTGIDYNKSQMQSKFGDLKKLYKAYMCCRGNSGFGYDHEKNLPTAPDEVWKSWLLTNPDHKKFRTMEVENFDVMERLFDGKIATGTYATASTTCSIPSTPKNMSSVTSRNTSDSDVSESGSEFMNKKRQKKENPIDKTNLLLEGIANRFNKESFMSQAMSFIDKDFMKYDGRKRVAIKKLFQNKEIAELFVLLSEEEREFWVEDELLR
jgi:hypothetical protein